MLQSTSDIEFKLIEFERRDGKKLYQPVDHEGYRLWCKDIHEDQLVLWRKQLPSGGFYPVLASKRKAIRICKKRVKSTLDAEFRKTGVVLSERLDP